MNLYQYVSSRPVYGTDPKGKDTKNIAVGGVGLLAIAAAAALGNHLGFYTFVSEKECREARKKNNEILRRLQIVIDSVGETSFQEAGLGGIWGTMGAPSTMDTVTYFESELNVGGWYSAAVEYVARHFTNAKWKGVPGIDDQTVVQRALLADALKARHQAFKDYLTGGKCGDVECSPKDWGTDTGPWRSVKNAWWIINPFN